MYKNVVPFGVNLHYYAMFFIIVFAFGNYVLFALFAAILLSHFEGDPEEDEGENESEEEGAEEEEEEVKEKQGFFSRKTWLAIRYAFIDNCGKRLRNDPYGKSN